MRKLSWVLAVAFVTVSITLALSVSADQLGPQGSWGLVEGSAVGSGGVVSSDLDMDGNTISDSSGILTLDDATTITGQLYVTNNNPINVNSSSYGAIVMRNTYQTVDSAFIHTGSVANYWIFTEFADRLTDFGHAQQTNPTWFIQSADATNVNQWISLAHDQTSAVVGSGAGGVAISGGGLIPPKATSDPCGADYPEASLFYNDTGNFWCGCDGTNDIKLSDGTACF